MSDVSSEGPFLFNLRVFLTKGLRNVRLLRVFQPFNMFDLYFYTAYAAHYVLKIFKSLFAGSEQVNLQYK